MYTHNGMFKRSLPRLLQRIPTAPSAAWQLGGDSRVPLARRRLAAMNTHRASNVRADMIDETVDVRKDDGNTCINT